MSGRAERESTRTVKGRKGGVERPAAQSARTRPASTTTRGTRGARLLTVRGRSVGRTNKEMKCRWERSERGQSPRRSPVTTIGITRHAPCAGCIRSSCVRDCHPQGRDGQGRQDRMMKGWLGSRDRQALAAAGCIDLTGWGEGRCSRPQLKPGGVSRAGGRRHKYRPKHALTILQC